MMLEYEKFKPVRVVNGYKLITYEAMIALSDAMMEGQINILHPDLLFPGINISELMGSAKQMYFMGDSTPRHNVIPIPENPNFTMGVNLAGYNLVELYNSSVFQIQTDKKYRNLDEEKLQDITRITWSAFQDNPGLISTGLRLDRSTKHSILQIQRNQNILSISTDQGVAHLPLKDLNNESIRIIVNNISYVIRLLACSYENPFNYIDRYKFTGLEIHLFKDNINF